MAWTRPLLLSLLAAVLLLNLCRETQSAAVKDDASKDTKDDASKDVKDDKDSHTGTQSKDRVFMEASDASRFLRRRSRRSPKSYAESMAEYRVMRAQSERRREYQEEQMEEFTRYGEETRTETNERTRETNEQYREFYYDGMYPRYPHHRHPR
ncbi:unique cartilage matrix-associated protein-like [Engraulis encrasicolus]|uniref:unique cartilage matrix-associated protein-like n=1 Tax=Engraulis encrasicolus TaxID=184585 RepID=UPI002FD5F774